MYIRDVERFDLFLVELSRCLVVVRRFDLGLFVVDLPRFVVVRFDLPRCLVVVRRAGYIYINIKKMY